MLERPLVILGCGFVGSRLARAALAAGRPVRACRRNPGKLAELAELGAEVMKLDAGKQRAFSPPLIGTTEATVLFSIPPQGDLPAGLAVNRAAQEALERGARRFIYLGSAGLYGNRPSEDWVDEDSTLALDDATMAPYMRDEAELQSSVAGGLHAVILRMAAVYGGGRGVRAKLRKGDYKMIDDGAHWISRIHVDDLVSIIFAAEERAPKGAVYLVADDRPTQQREYAEWLAKKLGVPMPPSVPAYAPGQPRSPQRGRRIRNAKLKRELDLTLKYPSFVEGEAQIDLEETGLASAPVPLPDAVTVPVTVPVPAPAPAPAPAPPPASQLHKLTLSLGTQSAAVDLRHPLGDDDAARVLAAVRALLTSASRP